MMIWKELERHVDLGFLPLLISDYDPRPVKDQLNTSYRHGGGWDPMNGFRFNPETRVLRYPGDPPMKPLAQTQLRDETVLFYPYSFLLVLQPDGAFEVSRVD